MRHSHAYVVKKKPSSKPTVDYALFLLHHDGERNVALSTVIIFLG